MKEYVMTKPLIEQNQKFFMSGVWTLTTEEEHWVYLSLGDIIIRVDKSILDIYFIENEIYKTRLQPGDILKLQTPSGDITDFEVQEIQMKNNAYGVIYVKVSC